MSHSPAEIANTLLRLGVLNPDDADQQVVREQLFSEPALYDQVKERLADVGFDLVQFFGYVGIRLSRNMELAPPVTLRNNLGLDARHVRVLVYLWIHLIQRQILQDMREERVEPMGREQTLFELDDVDEAPSLPHSELRAEFEDIYSNAQIKGILTTLKRSQFVLQDGNQGPLQAGPAMYVLIDHDRMEEFVEGLPQRNLESLPDGDDD